MKPSTPMHLSESPSAFVACSLVAYSHIGSSLHKPAAQSYFGSDDCVDCAQAFITHLLQKKPLSAPTYSSAYVQRCAANFVRNFRRNRIYLLRHEVA